jgi:cell division inhibitor SepF
MASAMRKIGEYLGLVEDTGTYDQYDAYDEHDTDAIRSDAADSASERQRRGRDVRTPAPVSDLAERRPRPVPSGVVELSRIITLQPRTYNEARTVGEQFRDGTPVIMNLTDMDDADAKRIVDFAAGLVFGTHGSIERVANKVFLLSPHNVSVAAEDKRRIAEGGFFNQS